jgi:hypothetical protein
VEDLLGAPIGTGVSLEVTANEEVTDSASWKLELDCQKDVSNLF